MSIRFLKLVYVALLHPRSFEELPSNNIILLLLHLRHKIHLTFFGNVKSLKKIHINELYLEKRPDIFLCWEWMRKDFVEGAEYVQFMMHERNRKHPDSYQSLSRRCKGILKSMQKQYLCLYFPLEVIPKDGHYVPLNTVRTSALLMTGQNYFYGKIRPLDSVMKGRGAWKHVERDAAWNRINRFMPKKSEEIRKRIEAWRKAVTEDNQ